MNTELKTKIEEFALLANIDPTLLGRFITNVSDANLDIYIGTFIKYRNYYVYVKEFQSLSNARIYSIKGNSFLAIQTDDLFQYSINKDFSINIPKERFFEEIEEGLTSEDFMNEFKDVKFIDMNAVYAEITDYKDYEISLPVEEEITETTFNYDMNESSELTTQEEITEEF